MFNPVFRQMSKLIPVTQKLAQKPGRYRPTRFIVASALVALGFAVLSGCQAVSSLSTTGGPGSSETDTSGEPLLDGVLLGKSADRARVSRDLVSALRQIDGLQPGATGLSMKTPDEPFARSLKQALIDARYELTVENEPAGESVVEYDIRPAASNPDAITIIVSVDRLKIKRDYVKKEGRTKPDSSLFVLGADPENIILDSAIFDEESPGTRIQTAAASTETPYNSVDLPPIIEAPEAEGVSTLDTAPATSFAIRAGTNLKRKRNIYDIGESNFLEVLKSYQDVDTRVLVFGNDSMRLGSSNKWFIKTMSKKFNANSDAFSVVGCSFGYTKIKNGNALLALGRAHRVKEELLRNGVPEDNILDEGCWSGGENDKDLPSRGVLLVLKRRT